MLIASTSPAHTLTPSPSETPRSSLTEWSKTHIGRVFEARSEAECVAAIRDTFTPTVSATLNGRGLTFAEITQLVLAIVRSGWGSQGAGHAGTGRGVTVHWQHTLEVPDDAGNRNGSFGGFYVLRGLRMELPGSSSAAEFERHKAISVRIESQSDDPSLDSRKICNLVFIASNVRVNGPEAVKL